MARARPQFTVAPSKQASPDGFFAKSVGFGTNIIGPSPASAQTYPPTAPCICAKADLFWTDFRLCLYTIRQIFSDSAADVAASAARWAGRADMPSAHRGGPRKIWRIVYKHNQKSAKNRSALAQIHGATGRYVCAKAGEASIMFVPKPKDFAKILSGPPCSSAEKLKSAIHSRALPRNSRYIN